MGFTDHGEPAFLLGRRGKGSHGAPAMGYLRAFEVDGIEPTETKAS